MFSNCHFHCILSYLYTIIIKRIILLSIFSWNMLALPPYIEGEISVLAIFTKGENRDKEKSKR